MADPAPIGARRIASVRPRGPGLAPVYPAAPFTDDTSEIHADVRANANVRLDIRADFNADARTDFDTDTPADDNARAGTDADEHPDPVDLPVRVCHDGVGAHLTRPERDGHWPRL